MHIENVTRDVASVVLSESEFDIINGSLGALLSVFDCDVPAVTGWSYDEATHLDDRMVALIKSVANDMLSVSFSKAEIIFFTKVIAEAVRELDVDFSTLVAGLPPSDALKLADELKQLALSMG